MINECPTLSQNQASIGNTTQSVVTESPVSGQHQTNARAIYTQLDSQRYQDIKPAGTSANAAATHTHILIANAGATPGQHTHTDTACDSGRYQDINRRPHCEIHYQLHPGSVGHRLSDAGLADGGC